MRETQGNSREWYEMDRACFKCSPQSFQWTTSTSLLFRVIVNPKSLSTVISYRNSKIKDFFLSCCTWTLFLKQLQYSQKYRKHEDFLLVRWKTYSQLLSFEVDEYINDPNRGKLWESRSKLNIQAIDEISCEYRRKFANEIKTNFELRCVNDFPSVFLSNRGNYQS